MKRANIAVRNVSRKSPIYLYFEGDSGGILGASPTRTTPQCLSEDSAADRDVRERGEKAEKGPPAESKESSEVSRPNHRLVSWKERKRRSQTEIPRQQHDGSRENPAGVWGAVGTGCLSHEPESASGSDSISYNEGGTEKYCLHNNRASGNSSHDCRVDASRTSKKSPVSPPLRLGPPVHPDLYSTKDDDAAGTTVMAELRDVPPSIPGDTADSDTNTRRPGSLNSGSSQRVLNSFDDTETRRTAERSAGTEPVVPGSETGEGSGGDTSITPFAPGSSSSHGHHSSNTARGHNTGEETESTDIAVSGSSRCVTDDVAVDRRTDRYGGSRVFPRRSDHKETASADKLRSLLRKEKEEKTKQREGKEVAEREAKMALASLEANAKRYVSKPSYWYGMKTVFVPCLSFPMVVGNPVFTVFSTSLLFG